MAFPFAPCCANGHSFRTCVVSSLRLTVVLGHGSANFTWYYVPLGAYSVFEPLGGILCTNLPIIWHMMRKRRAARGLPHHNTASKVPSSEGHTPTIGSSRRSRLAFALGLTSHDRTSNNSQMQTMTDNAGPSQRDWQQLENIPYVAKPDTEVWTTLERIDSGDENGPSEPLKPGMRKTVWNIRK